MIELRRSNVLADATKADLGYSPKAWLAATGAAVVGGALGYVVGGIVGYALSPIVAMAGIVVGFSIPIAVASPMVYEHGVPNLAEVDPGVYRSGQPTTPEAWSYLRSLGIEKVVKLNFDTEGSDQGAIDVGMEVVNIPIPPRDDQVTSVFEPPETAKVLDAVRILGEGKPGHAVLVHCSHGQDRTGIVVGAYRVLHDGWTKKRAYDEMIAHHFHWEIQGLARFWNDFDVKRAYEEMIKQHYDATKGTKP